MTEPEDVAQAGLEEANKDKADFSGHGEALGAAGFLDPDSQGSHIDHLGKRGDTLSVTPAKEGFGKIRIAAAWDNPDDQTSFVTKLLSKKKDVDLDLGCLYELQDGQRGALQALGSLRGDYDAVPYMKLSKDEQTGDKQGDDEWIDINGAEWPKIKRILFYVYIYKGATNWAEFRPQIQVRIPEEKPMVVTIASSNENMDICAIGGIENVRNGIKLSNYTEYFPGQAEMDRAFGFGIEWADGTKREG